MDYLVKLYGLPPVEADIQKLHGDGINIKRAICPEKYAVTGWVQTKFGRGWASECDVSFSNHPVSCFIAIKDRALIGFCCYEATCKGFIGPCGVAQEFRSKGIGRTLLLKSLHAMAQEGHAYAIIGAGINNYFERKIDAIPIPGSSPGIYRDMLK